MMDTTRAHYWHDEETGMEYWHDGEWTREQCHDGVGLVTSHHQSLSEFFKLCPYAEIPLQ